MSKILKIVDGSGKKWYDADSNRYYHLEVEINESSTELHCNSVIVFSDGKRDRMCFGYTRKRVEEFLKNGDWKIMDDSPKYRVKAFTAENCKCKGFFVTNPSKKFISSLRSIARDKNITVYDDCIGENVEVIRVGRPTDMYDLSIVLNTSAYLYSTSISNGAKVIDCKDVKFEDVFEALEEKKIEENTCPKAGDLVELEIEGNTYKARIE